MGLAAGGCILLVLGIAVGIVRMGGQPQWVGEYFREVLSSGISHAVSGTFQALVWTTIGFVIAERSGAKRASCKKWSVADLPTEVSNSKARIPLSDSIMELVMLILFGTFFLLILLGALPIVFVSDQSTVITQLFSTSFLGVCIPILIATIVLEIPVIIAKISVRRWTPGICIAVVLNGAVGIGAMLFLLTRPTILSADIVQYLQGLSLGDFDLLRFMGEPIASPIRIITGGLTVIFGVIEMIQAIYKTVKYRKAGIPAA